MYRVIKDIRLLMILKKLSKSIFDKYNVKAVFLFLHNFA